MSPADIAARLISAANACREVPGARVSIHLESEEQAAELAQLLGCETWGHACIYAHWGSGNGRRWLFGFRAQLHGVEVDGQGDRAATDAELKNASVWDPPETTPAMRDAAIAATEVS